MGVFDSSYVKAPGVKSAGLKKYFWFFRTPVHYGAVVSVRERKNYKKEMARFYSFFDQLLTFWFVLV